MRVCSSCGRENPDDRDFCECGEYLRWDPTGVVQAVTPEMLQGAEPPAPAAGPEPAAAPPAPMQPPPPAARPASPPPAPEGPGNGHGEPPAPAPPPAAPVPTMRQAAVSVPAPAPAAPAQPAEPEPAAISLRLPEGEQVGLGETLAVGAEPGGRARLLALVRNQSGIVDNYDL
jgi:hypothetical protein